MSNTKIVAHNIDLLRNQIHNRVIQILPTAQVAPIQGLEYYSSANDCSYEYSSTYGWVPRNAALMPAASIPISVLSTNPLARANHTGTQPSATISDLKAVVNTYTLDSFASPAGNVSMNGFTLTNLNNAPNAAGMAVEYSWFMTQMNTVTNSIQASQAGLEGKLPCACIYTTDVVLSGLIPSSDSISPYTPISGQRVLVIGKTDATKNGVYLVAAGAWSRDIDIINSQSVWLISDGGTYVGSQYKVTNTGAITVGVTPITITQWSIGNSYTAGNGMSLIGSQFNVNVIATNSGLISNLTGLAVDFSVVSKKANAVIGDGLSTTFVITHNFGTRNVITQVMDNVTFDKVDVTCNNTTANTVTVSFLGVVPAINSFTVTCIG